ncbi:hypothetical protein HGP28_02125 [Vibrio sp. SM6]|uniref:GH26 domain-containing protein n=1 Tax=Vibrio agarilyticus TaxID=2726741 RepID=A0A7X8TND1_9VIBR|nr:glycosyl hydrolase [Vibrio agarilyticus]NLS11686.1 hypothetical protein [Vibrio agarilyticus]
MRRYLLALISFALITACSSSTPMPEQEFVATPITKPENIRLFVGQDLGAVGGLAQYDNGYVDYFGHPAGITIYTSLQSLEGLTEKVNYGAGDNHANLYLQDPGYNGVDIAIGLSLVDQLDKVNSGELDANIVKFAQWMAQSERKIYLRIGYEFEGAWNGYAPESYKKAFRRIVDGLRKEGVSNVEFVWQSSGYEEERDDLLQYYPGDNYVDWIAYSYFNHDPKEAGKEMLRLAREKGKPVMIAELTPRGANLMLDDGKELWDSWFVPFLQHLEDNQDVIGIIAYINALWDEQPMWKGQGWGDTRLQSNLYLSGKWRRTIKREGWETTSTLKQPPIFILPEDYEEQKAARDKMKPNLTGNESQLQAEDAIPRGNVRIYPDSAAVGGKGMAYMYQTGDGLKFENVTQSNYIAVRYATINTGKIGLAVNGSRAYDLTFEGTGSWVGTYDMIEQQVSIPDGADVEIIFESGDSALNIDYVMFDRR